LSGTPQDMVNQLLKGNWKDKVKSNALDAVYQYAEFIGKPITPVKFRVFDNQEMYIPTPDMVKAFLYRVTKVVRARIMVALETSASAGEVWRLTWNDLNVQNKSLTVIGVKGHKTLTYTLSDELFHLLIQIPRKSERIFYTVFHPEHMNDRINYYAKLLAKETGNDNYKKIHFHTFRHYAISWYYFKCKDPFMTQRYARHHSIINTQKYVHFVNEFWVKSKECDVVYAENKEELTRCLSEGFSLVTKTDWGYCLSKPKTIY
jgi:integrase